MKMKKIMGMVMLVLMTVMCCPMLAFAAEEAAEYVPSMYATFWALIPPVIAIVLALITKEVYSSLFLGILFGGLFYSGFNFEGTVTHIYNNGFVGVLSSSGNIGILIFLVLLGAMVALMNRAGGSASFGRWASEHIKSRVGAQLATVLLGCLIFIDDYFNCLTVGSVMLPVANKHNISRAKLAYLIDATAAPICIIAPVSSWAAAVAGYVEGEDAFALFIRAIPFNFYALLTIIMMIAVAVMKADYGPMRIHEKNALKGDVFTTKEQEYVQTDDIKANPRGKVFDLVIPIISLVICCVIGMLYTGGFFDGVSFVQAFSDCSASTSLAYGSFFGLIITIVLYLIRRVLSFKECMECLPEGFKAMVPAILILVLAWTLNAMTGCLGADVYVAGLVENSAEGFMNLLPAIIFLVGCFLAFSTGTSWGTFGILIPIVVEAFGHDEKLMIIAISACMAGAVCGDHCSPISDTTIMASAGAQCNHINHVNTQLPYALTVAAVSFVTYIVAGFTKSAWISLPVGIILMIGTLFIIKTKTGTIED